jgi:hypothetical protein
VGYGAVCHDRISGWRLGRAGGHREQADGASPFYGVVAAIGAELLAQVSQVRLDGVRPEAEFGGVGF